MNTMFHNARVSFAICTPMAKVTNPHGVLMFDTLTPEWHRARASLAMPTNINLVELLADGMEVGDARSKIAKLCLESKPIPEFLFFLDSDVIVPSDALTKLFYNARCYPDYDVYAGVYCSKTNPPEPLIYGDNGTGAIWDWAVGDLLMDGRVKSVHMGLTLIRTSAFRKLLDSGLVHGTGDDQEDEPFFKTVNETEFVNGNNLLKRGTEDIYFCDKLIKAGGKIFVNTGVLAAHHCRTTGIMYGLPVDKTNNPFRRAKWMKDGDKTQDVQEAENLIYEGPCECVKYLTNETEFPEQYKQLDNSTLCLENCVDCKGTGHVKRPYKIAIDIGAGDTRREWPGYKTYTTDIRSDSKPDYVQDSRALTLPNNHFDLVASSHHLEHIGRWDQEKVWKEMFKICKPGGRIEHVVPNIQWAAASIMENNIDEHVMNVIYGAQEAHGYAREFNTHFFGYTPELAKALARSVGFVDVETGDWRQNPKLGYNLLIKGRKPYPDEVVKDTVVMKARKQEEKDKKKEKEPEKTDQKPSRSRRSAAK